MQDSEENTDNSSKKKRESKFLRKKNTHIHAGLECWCCCGAKKKEKLIRGKQRKSQQKVSNLIRVRMCGWLFEFVCSQENYQCCKVVKLSLLFTQKTKKKLVQKYGELSVRVQQSARIQWEHFFVFVLVGELFLKGLVESVIHQSVGGVI